MQTTLIRYGGVAAILAGVLRGVAAFVPSTTGGVEVLYLITDICILLATVGLYGLLGKSAGRWGMIGFLLTWIGVAILLVRDVTRAGEAFYAVGALIFAGGLCLLAVGAWYSSRLPCWIPVFWIISTFIGIIGFFVPGATALFVVAGVMFALSLMGAGVQMWRVGADRVNRS